MIRHGGLLVALMLTACAANPPGPAAAIELDRIPIIYGGGGAIRGWFGVPSAQWEGIAAMFAASPDAAGERRAVRAAVGSMERIAGEQTITWMDKSCNGNGGPTEQGQLDCIDESTNTTTYLTLFEQRGLLRFHRVLAPVWRAPHLVDTHRTAVIQDLADGATYAVDSWYGDNGESPFIQALADWKRKTPPPPQ